MISPRFQIRVLLVCMTFCVVLQSGGAGVFPAAPGDLFGDGPRCLGRTSNGVVRIIGYHNGYGFFEFNGTGFTFIPLTPLPGDDVYGATISRDGVYIAGGGDWEGVLWSSAAPNAPTPLGFLPGDISSGPSGVANTSNGPVVVGWSDTASFVWTPSQGILGVSEPPAHGSTRLDGISADGRVVVGFSTATHLGFDPVLRDGETWRILDRGNFPASYDYPNGADSLSHDGTVVAGYAGGKPAYWSGTNFDLHMVTMNNTNLSISWGAGIATDGGWVAGGSGGRAWIASVTDGKAQYIEDWIHDHYGLVVTQSVTSVYDLLVDQGELFMILANNSGGMLFTGSVPSPPIPAPSLALALLPSGQIELRWPTNASCTVETTLALTTPPAWTPLTNAVPLLTNSQFVLTLPVTNSASFYRLRCP